MISPRLSSCPGECPEIDALMHSRILTISASSNDRDARLALRGSEQEWHSEPMQPGHVHQLALVLNTYGLPNMTRVMFFVKHASKATVRVRSGGVTLAQEVGGSHSVSSLQSTARFYLTQHSVDLMGLG